ncbi:MAG: hypothetical protein RL074_99, partial [Bacteroidota bacterium]
DLREKYGLKSHQISMRTSNYSPASRTPWSMEFEYFLSYLITDNSNEIQLSPRNLTHDLPGLRDRLVGGLHEY